MFIFPGLILCYGLKEKINSKLKKDPFKDQPVPEVSDETIFSPLPP